MPPYPKAVLPRSAGLGIEAGPLCIEVVLDRTDSRRVLQVKPCWSKASTPRYNTAAASGEKEQWRRGCTASPTSHRQGNLRREHPGCPPRGDITHHSVWALWSLERFWAFGNQTAGIWDNLHNRDRCLDASRLRKLLSRHILRVSCGFTAS